MSSSVSSLMGVIVSFTVPAIGGIDSELRINKLAIGHLSLSSATLAVLPRDETHSLSSRVIHSQLYNLPGLVKSR